MVKKYYAGMVFVNESKNCKLRTMNCELNYIPLYDISDET